MSVPATFHERVVMGVELEAYTILTPGYRVSRSMAFPRKGLGEKGERFTRDASIGTEYNSRPFSTIREGLFLLKAGLRKYSSHLYASKSTSRKARHILLVGGWRDRFAGAHIHLSIADRDFDKADGRRLAWHLHDHIPFLIAMGTNSPVWADEITAIASNRVMLASKVYFRPTERGVLTQRNNDEMLWSPGRKRKPATLEIRVLDSNVPEFVIAAATIVKALTLNWLRGNAAVNRVPVALHRAAREDAARRGMKARLNWNGDPVTVRRYLDLLVWSLRDELDAMDIPEDVWTAIKLLKRGWNGSAIIAAAARAAHARHPQTWQQRFARRYVSALGRLLSGHPLPDFMERLQVAPPELDEVWLGRRNLSLGA